MSVTLVLPDMAYVATADGPCFVSALRAGDDLVVLEANGSLGSAAVVAVEGLAERPCACLLTKVGPLIVPESASVITKTGPRRVSEVMLDANAGRRTRLEVLSPQDVPAVAKAATAAKGAAAALSLFDGMVMIPWTVAELGEHEKFIAKLAKAAGGVVDVTEADGWLVLHSPHRVDALPAGRPAQLAAEASALEVLMAWEVVDSGWRMRAPLGRMDWTLRALAALAAAGRPGAVTWQPGYFPVDVRIEPDVAQRGHSEVIHAPAIAARCSGVQIERRGSIVLGGAMVDARL